MHTDESQEAKLRRRARFYGVWFVCIGIGFCLLGIRSWIEGDVAWRTGIRFLISVGFMVGGAGYLRQSKGGRQG